MSDKIVPWYILQRVECFPDCSCEPMNIMSYVHQPVAAFSSLAYIIAAYFIWKTVPEKTQRLKQFVSIASLMGLTSFWAHANYSYISIAMDYASIIMIIGFFFFDDFFYKHLKTFKQIAGGMFLTYAFFTLVFYQFVVSFQVTLTWLIFITAIIHMLRVKGLKPLGEMKFMVSMALFGFSFLFFLFDKHDYLCKMTYLPYGHTLWHFGTALALFMYSQWMFRDVKSP